MKIQNVKTTSLPPPPNTMVKLTSKVNQLTLLYILTRVRVLCTPNPWHNGRRKIHAEVEMFMTEFNINDCIKSLKIKNTEDNINFSKHILFYVPDDVFETIIFLHLILTKTI